MKSLICKSINGNITTEFGFKVCDAPNTQFWNSIHTVKSTKCFKKNGTSMTYNIGLLTFNGENSKIPLSSKTFLNWLKKSRRRIISKKEIQQNNLICDIKIYQ